MSLLAGQASAEKFHDHESTWDQIKRTGKLRVGVTEDMTPKDWQLQVSLEFDASRRTLGGFFVFCVPCRPFASADEGT